MSDLFFPDAALAMEAVEADQVGRKIRAKGGSLMMVEVFFKSGAIGAAHRHVHEQVCYCLAGEFLFSIEGEERTLRAGDSVYVPSSVLHGAKCLAAGRLLDIFTPQREDFATAYQEKS